MRWCQMGDELKIRMAGQEERKGTACDSVLTGATVAVT